MLNSLETIEVTIVLVKKYMHFQTLFSLTAR